MHLNLGRLIPRFDVLQKARALMSDQGAAARLKAPATLADKVREGYSAGRAGDSLWKYIYESSQRSNPEVDARYGSGDAGVPFYLWDGDDN